MKLIATKQGKTEKYDLLRCVRADGSESSTRMPRQGVLPHDLLHYVVESALGYEHGFLGIIARGAEFNYTIAQVHDLNNPALADQATHAEALVESLQAQLWSGSFDPVQFRDGLEGACAVRGRSAPSLDGLDLQEILYQCAIDLGQRWHDLLPHGALELEMPGLAASIQQRA